LGSEVIASAFAAGMLVWKHRLPFGPPAWTMACLTLVSLGSAGTYALTEGTSPLVLSAGFLAATAIAILLFLSASRDAREVWHDVVAAPISKAMASGGWGASWRWFGRPAGGGKPRDG
jgi:hypothetical protein